MTFNIVEDLSPPPAHVPTGLVYDYDFIADPRLIAEPQQRMRSLHEEAPPLFWSPRYGGHWVVTSKKILQDIALNTADFSSGNRMLPPSETPIVLVPSTLDPPLHTAYRMPLNPHFLPGSMARHADLIRRTAIELIDAVAGSSRCEFLSQVAEAFPSTIFLHILGVPLRNLREFRDLAKTFMGASAAADRAAAYARISEIVGETVTERMAEPRKDLISALAGLDFGGRKLSRAELVDYAAILFVGGLDTVVNGLSFSIRYLALHPELQSELRADPGKIPSAVEELLRLHAVATPMRTAMRDLTLHGVHIRKGEQLVLLVAAINYDPEAFANAGAFCPHRPEAHVTFNMGPHRCIGASLGRLELKIFLEEWLQRIPAFRLDPRDPPTFGGGFSITVKSLPLLLS